MKNKTELWIIIGIVLIAIIVIATKPFLISSLTGAKPNPVLIPNYATLSCQQTRTEYYPQYVNGALQDGNNIGFEAVPSSGKSYYCSGLTMPTNSYFEHGCEIDIQSTGCFNRVMRICNTDGSGCQDMDSAITTNAGCNGGTIKYPLDYNKKIFVTAKGILFSTDYKIRMVAPVYGIAIQGSGVKPTFTSTCNLQSLFSNDILKIFQNDPNYQAILDTNQISDSLFPQVFITSYSQSYDDKRVISRNNAWYFIEDIGYICQIDKTSDGAFAVVKDGYYATSKCMNDPTIQCFPGIGNCDSTGKLTTAPTNSGCVPNTLIGTSGGRKIVYGNQACYLKCDSNGVQQLDSCVQISACAVGYAWNDNYQCVKILNTTVTVPSDYTIFWIIGAFLVGVIAILIYKNYKR